MKRSQLALFKSVMALLLCFSMLIGATFAWFTDSVSSGTNMIAAGSLDIELDYLAKDGTWKTVNASTEVLDKNALWEPGYTEVAYLRITNAGSLALKYALGIGILAETGSINAAGEAFKLSDHIKFGVVESETPITYAGREEARNALTETKFIREGLTTKSSMTNKGDVRYLALVVYMPEEVGNVANYATGATPPEIKLGIELVATQEVHESDSFGTDYDTGATMPGFSFPENLISDNASANVTVDAENKVAGEVNIQGTTSNAFVPDGVLLEEGTTELTLAITPMSKSDANIILGENEAVRSLDVHVQGVAADNTMPMQITIQEAAPKGLNMGNYKFYHVENGNTVEMTYVESNETFTGHNQFKYDPATGDIILNMATFSEVAMVANTENAWKGEFDYSWYKTEMTIDDTEQTAYTIANADQLAAFGAIVGGMNGQTKDSFTGKTVKLIADVNLGDAEEENNPDLIFYPIGYYNSTGSYKKTSGGSVTSSVSSFEGTFDGQGHTIANFYQNTWEMFGDYNDGYSGTPNHYKDAMGLFGYVTSSTDKRATVKNLTVSNFSSDGEFTPTGVIAAYAAGNSTFENIAITNCNPRVYNTGNGGIIGIAGDTSAANDDHITLKNITVDNSNKISALWGSYDVACGGLVGMYRGNVDGNGNATGDTISFTNCHVSAQMDVYNDVCANYQYYAYRYAGMIIGSVRHNTKNAEGKTVPNMTGISATGCTVNYGDWNDYYYCEFEKNTMASYSEDYQFSRVPHSELNFTDSNGNGLVDANERASVTGCKHDHTAEENHQAIYLPFHQLFTGYSWGVSSIGLEKYGGIVTNLDITEGDQEESVEKFETKFTGDFLYRVGNQNTVSVGSLFAAKDGATINDSGVVVTVDKVNENSNVSGTFTANTTDWTKGTIQFTGTGVVKVTIQDYNFCTPTELYLEVVDAVNATSATNATSNNVVLLQNCGFGSLEVSGGYTLYGNGFTMTCGSDSAALDMGYSFVTLNNGTLDNVQIVTPNFDYAVLYKSNMTESGNRSETTDRTRYYNVKSGVMASGNSQILNSRISGGRAAVNVSGGNVVIDNSRIELGAVASILVGSANSLTLRDVTLVQKPTVSTHDSSKTLMGFSVLYLCDSEGKATPTTLEGSFVQQAWVNADDKKYVPSAGQDIVDGVMKETAFIHNINGKDSLNLGFAYMPEDAQKTVEAPGNITDNRTDKATIPYEMKDVKIQIAILSTTVYVYSYKNTNGTADIFKTESDYVPNKQNDNITVTYSDTADGLETGKSFGTDGWIYELNVDLDKLPGYTLDFNKLSMSVNGVAVTDFKVNGNAKPTSPVAVTAGGVTYTLTATVDGKECAAYLKVTGTETSKESPSKISGPTTAGFGVAKSYGGDWSGAADVLTGVKVKYWSVAENKYVEVDFSNFTVPGNAGKLNGTNNYWEYTHANNDFTLKVTNTTAIHSGKSVYGMPIRGTDGKLYFTISSTTGYVGSGTTSRSVEMQYEFTDNNGGEKLTFKHTFNISYNKDDQYSYSDLSGSGKLTKLTGGSSGGSCVTPDTLITLADGSQVRVDSLKGNEQLLVWNLETGKYDTAPIVFVDNDPEQEYEIIHLYFSDGSDVKVISEHGFFDLDLGKYVYIDAANYADYVGHKFVTEGAVAANEWNTVTLDKVIIEKDVTTAWSPVTFEHLCYYTNGVLSMPGGIEGLFNIFEVDTDLMRYDAEQMQKDLETYGLFTVEDFGGMITEDAFCAFNGAYLKAAMGKGLLTWEDVAYMAERYIPLM